MNATDEWPARTLISFGFTARFGSPKLAHVFGEKVQPAFLEQLVELDLAVRGGRRDPYWIGMHPKLATLYMLALADAMAQQRGAHPITDDTLNHLAVGGFTMERLAGALLDDVIEPQHPSDQEVEQLAAGLILQVVVPVDLDHVPARKLLAFRDKYAAERAAFQQQVEALAYSLHGAAVTDTEALRDHVQAQYDKTLRPELADLRRRLRDVKIEAVMGLIDVKTLLPPGLLAVGGFTAAGEIEAHLRDRGAAGSDWLARGQGHLQAPRSRLDRLHARHVRARAARGRRADGAHPGPPHPGGNGMTTTLAATASVAFLVARPRRRTRTASADRCFRWSGGWCARGDSNPHARRHQDLNLACLPFHHSRCGSEDRSVECRPARCGW